jgi:hypothetical protein
MPAAAGPCRRRRAERTRLSESPRGRVRCLRGVLAVAGRTCPARTRTRACVHARADGARMRGRVHTHVHTHVRGLGPAPARGLCACTPLRLHACTPLRLHASTPACLYACTPAHLYASTPARLYACTPLRLHTGLCAYTCARRSSGRRGTRAGAGPPRGRAGLCGIGSAGQGRLAEPWLRDRPAGVNGDWGLGEGGGGTPGCVARKPATGTGPGRRPR